MIFYNNYSALAFPDRDLNMVGPNNRFTSLIVDISVTGSASAWRRKLIETSNIVKDKGLPLATWHVCVTRLDRTRHAS